MLAQVITFLLFTTSLATSTPSSYISAVNPTINVTKTVSAVFPTAGLKLPDFSTCSQTCLASSSLTARCTWTGGVNLNGIPDPACACSSNNIFWNALLNCFNAGAMICQDGQDVANWLSNLCDKWDQIQNSAVPVSVSGKVLVTQPGATPSTSTVTTQGGIVNGYYPNGYPYSPNVVVVPMYPNYYPQQPTTQAQVTQVVKPMTALLSVPATATVVLTVNGALVTITQEVQVPVPTDIPTAKSNWALSVAQPSVVESELPAPTSVVVVTVTAGTTPTASLGIPGVVRPIQVVSSTRTNGIGRPIILETAIADINVVNAPGSKGQPLVDGNLGVGQADLQNVGQVKKVGVVNGSKRFGVGLVLMGLMLLL